MTVRFYFILLISILCMTSNVFADDHHIWSESFGDTADDWGIAVTVDGNGYVYLTGVFEGAVDFGGGLLTGVGDRDIFLAKYDTSGNHIWSRDFGGLNEDAALAVTVDGSNNVIITGFFNNTINFGGGMLISNGMREFYLAKFDADGNHVWSLSDGSPLSDGAHGIAVDDTGSVYATGWYDACDEINGSDRIFLVKYDSTGSQLWAQTYGDSSEDTGTDVAVDGDNNVLATGYFKNSIDFGGGPLSSAGWDDIYIAKLDPAGNHIWSRSFGDTGMDWSNGIAVDGAGNVLVTGFFSNTVDFGGGPRTSAGAEDIFVAKYDPAGNHIWSRRFGGTGGDGAWSIAVDGEDATVITGVFTETVDFGGGPLVCAGSQDVFIAKYNASGAHMWSRSFGDMEVEEGRGVAVDPNDNVIATGYFYGTVNLGGELLTSAGNADIFFAKFDSIGVGIHGLVPEPEITAYSYPNPFGPKTTIAVVLHENSQAAVRIYDAGGRLVRALFDGAMDRGLNRVTWDGTDAHGNPVSSGVYFFRLNAGNKVLAKKMVLLK
jgi:hypothetical protein